MPAQEATCRLGPMRAIRGEGHSSFVLCIAMHTLLILMQGSHKPVRPHGWPSPSCDADPQPHLPTRLPAASPRPPEQN